MLGTLLTIAILPRVDAGAEVAHDFGLSALRGTITLALEVVVAQAPTWHVDVFTATRSFVRYNQPPESPVRISPQQVHYPVGLRVRFPVGEGRAWGLFAFHQSNHDIDSDDAVLNQETVSFEVYGAEWVMPHLHVHGGLYWDRGTRLDGFAQDLPFNHYLAGITVEADYDVAPPWYGAAKLELVAHRGAAHDPGYLNMGGHVDLGARWFGAAGAWSVFLRGQRVEDYQHLEDEPVHLLLIGTGMGAL